MQFGILPLQYSYCRVHICSLVSCHCSKVTAECMHAVWYSAIAIQLLQSVYMQFGILPLQFSDCRVHACSLVSCHCSKVTVECVHAVWYPAIAVQLVTADCLHVVWYPATAVRLLQSVCMQFGILPLQYSYCRVRTCSLVSCHCSSVTAECMHAVWWFSVFSVGTFPKIVPLQKNYKLNNWP
jgi:hypothetical protein